MAPRADSKENSPVVLMFLMCTHIGRDGAYRNRKRRSCYEYEDLQVCSQAGEPDRAMGVARMRPQARQAGGQRPS